MTLKSGSQLGPYEILEPIGAGGMGEVYRARDPSLERDVAVKLLPEGTIVGPARLARFEREAKLLGALNHPGIASIYAVQHHHGRPALILELVEGRTLEDRLKRGALPVPEALDVARQIAEALADAHEHGIIHRDLKPSNIKLTPGGRVKLLDFGLAKALGDEEHTPSSVTTATTPEDGTVTGIVLGTAPYMSPEQARGEELDRRTDVWAFGCVLYELLAGRRAFPGPTRSDAIAAVLEREPDWEALPVSTPLLVRSLLRQCLRKDRAKRLHDIADAGIEIEEALAEPVGPSSSSVSMQGVASDSRRIGFWAAGSLTIGAVIASLVAWWTLRPPPPAPHTPQRLTVSPSRKAPLSGTGTMGRLALSPNGMRLVYVGRVDGKRQLVLRSMEQLEATPIPGTEGAVSPFFSPGGEWVGFQQDRKLKRISLQGGSTPLTICETPDWLRGASWSEDGTILFQARAGLSRVPAEGGTPELVAARNPDETLVSAYRWPQILPGGKAALFTIQAPSGRHDECRIAILSLETGEQSVLFRGGTLARYVPSGHLVFTRYGSLLAVPFDLRRLEVTGGPVKVLEDVSMYPSGAAYLAVSRTGSLAYVTGRYGHPEFSLVWVDRQGDTEPLTEERRAYAWPRVSPDGTRLAVTISRPDGSDIWVHDLRQGTWTRLTFEKDNRTPVWSPDGRRLAFASNREGPFNLCSAPADGSGTPERLRTSRYWERPNDWSPDGRFLLFDQQAGASFDLWVLPLEGRGQARPYLATPFTENSASFSPDGRWVTYHSNESGGPEVYVRSFPDPGRKWTVSTEGGLVPQWSPDGREIFFRESGRMMVAAVQTEPTFRSGPPRMLFDHKGQMHGIAISPDGKRFVAVLRDEEEPEPEQIVVIPDFAEELKAKFREAGQ